MIARLLLYHEVTPLDEDASALAAVALVHRRTLRDPPSQCLPTPPLRSRDLAVELSADEASASQVALLAGHLMDALLLIAFGRSAAFAAAPERAALLAHQQARNAGRRGGGAASSGALGSAAPLQLESWAGALEADIQRRHKSAIAELAVAEAEAARQQAAWVGRGHKLAPPIKASARAGGGAFGSMLENVGDGDGTVDVSEVVDNVVDTSGVEAALVSQLAALRRTVAECEKALSFSATMRELVTSADAECPVCLEVHTVAAVMPCLHSTCRECMRKHAGAAATFRCPLCRKAVSRSEVTTFTKAAPSSTPVLDVAHELTRQATRRLPDGVAAITDTVSTVAVHVAAPFRDPAVPSEQELPHTSSRMRALVALLLSLLELGPDERVLVFAQYAAHVSHTAEVLRSAHVAFLTLGNSLPESMAALQAFGQPEQPRVLLMSSQKHASGINLQCGMLIPCARPALPMRSRW